MSEILALALDDAQDSNVTYYADDKAQPSIDFLSLFEEDDEDLTDDLALDHDSGKLEGDASAVDENVLTIEDFEDDDSDGIDTEIDGEAEITIDDSSSNMDAADGALLPMPQDDNLLPGAQVAFIAVKDEPEKDTTWEDDGDHVKFLDYAEKKLNSIPRHSGQTTVGCEKAIAYLRKLDKEVSRAIQTDEVNVIDEKRAEAIRDKIHDFVARLEEALDAMMGKKKKKKKASFSLGKTIVARINDGDDIQYFASVTADNDEEVLLKVDVLEPDDGQVQAFIKGTDSGLTKEAAQLVTFIDPFLQSITRLLMRAHITQGKDIRQVYAQLDDQYKFTPREQLSIHELLLQKGLPVHTDLGRLLEKDPSPFDGKNVEFATTYPAL
jgi:hypothetical protein